MLTKKRIIFTLLYADGYFFLSRNFRLQRVGDIDWLEKNYNFSKVSRYVDELVLLNVSRTEDISWEPFVKTVGRLAHRNFVPISVGGFGQEINRARELLRNGADKLVLNTALFERHSLVEQIVATFGRQVVVGSLDVGPGISGQNCFFTRRGSSQIPLSIDDAVGQLPIDLIGEFYVQSIFRDGTGQGLDLDLVERLAPALRVKSLVISGGVGKPEHIVEGLAHPMVAAVATANLLNFVGDGLRLARQSATERGAKLASWPDSYEANT